MKKQASLKDLRRMCDHYAGSMRHCRECPLADYDCDITTTNDLDKINDIVVKWCEEHPVQTRADVFFKQYPFTDIRYLADGSTIVPNICPKSIDTRSVRCSGVSCDDCKKKYWLQEVSE